VSSKCCCFYFLKIIDNGSIFLCDFQHIVFGLSKFGLVVKEFGVFITHLEPKASEISTSNTLLPSLNPFGIGIEVPILLFVVVKLFLKLLSFFADYPAYF
jgi:hypothetical protein